MHVLQLYKQGQSIAAIARYTGNNWHRIKRWIDKAQEIENWIKTERAHSPPCMLPRNEWPHFTRDFSYAFYPQRYGIYPINTKRIFL
jgi:hypothetical protein